MKITTNQTQDTTVYFVPADGALDMLSNDVADYALNTLDFKGKINETFIHIGPNTDNSVLIGLGVESKLTKDHFVNAANTAAKVLNKQKVTSTSVQLTSYNTVDAEAVLQGVVEGFLQADYSFDTNKKDKTNNRLKTVSILSDSDNADELVKETVNILNSVNLTRDLVNTPANDLYPETLVDKVEEAFKDTA
ncbi:MAG: hypothetical protein GX317_06670, partial [Staphylococcus equorum]|nr:hypothetical protein [Staphylococcus equorum]